MGAMLWISENFSSLHQKSLLQKNNMAEVQGAAQEESLPLDGVEENSDKGDFVSTEQSQLYVTN
jgi:hypothetical protein